MASSTPAVEHGAIPKDCVDNIDNHSHEIQSTTTKPAIVPAMASSTPAVEHGAIPKDCAECLCCFEDFDKESFVEFRSAPSGVWQPCKFCATTVRHLLANQYPDYLKKVQESDCKAALRRLIEAGPPEYLSDKTALPLARETDTHVDQLWFNCDGKEVSAALDGALHDEERDRQWKELREMSAVLMEALPESKT